MIFPMVAPVAFQMGSRARTGDGLRLIDLFAHLGIDHQRRHLDELTS